MAENPALGVIVADQDLYGLLNDLAEWALTECYFPFAQEKISRDEEQALYVRANKLMDPVIFAWGHELESLALEAGQRHGNLSGLSWMQALYCYLVYHVLLEFEKLVRNLNQSGVYYARYVAAQNMFENILEVPFVSMMDWTPAAYN
jgi:hypothetical protein